MVFEPVVGGRGRVHEALKRHRLFAARSSPLASHPLLRLILSWQHHRKYFPRGFADRERERESAEEEGEGELHSSLRLIDSAHRLADKPDQPVMTFTREMAGRKNGRRRRRKRGREKSVRLRTVWCNSAMHFCRRRRRRRRSTHMRRLVYT